MELPLSLLLQSLESSGVNGGVELRELLRLGMLLGAVLLDGMGLNGGRVGTWPDALYFEKEWEEGDSGKG